MQDSVPWRNSSICDSLVQSSRPVSCVPEKCGDQPQGVIAEWDGATYRDNPPLSSEHRDRTLDKRVCHNEQNAQRLTTEKKDTRCCTREDKRKKKRRGGESRRGWEVGESRAGRLTQTLIGNGRLDPFFVSNFLLCNTFTMASKILEYFSS